MSGAYKWPRFFALHIPRKKRGEIIQRLAFFRESQRGVVFGLPWIISFHYEPPVGRAQAVTPQVLLKNTRLVSQRAGHSGHFLF